MPYVHNTSESEAHQKYMNEGLEAHRYKGDVYRKCDICKVVFPEEEKHRVNWFGATSCMVCDKPECRAEMQRSWDENAARIQREEAAKKEWE